MSEQNYYDTIELFRDGRSRSGGGRSMGSRSMSSGSRTRSSFGSRRSMPNRQPSWRTVTNPNLIRRPKHGYYRRDGRRYRGSYYYGGSRWPRYYWWPYYDWYGWPYYDWYSDWPYYDNLYVDTPIITEIDKIVTEYPESETGKMAPESETRKITPESETNQSMQILQNSQIQLFGISIFVLIIIILLFLYFRS